MPAKMTEVQAVRIICDSILKDDLLKRLQELGATGWTCWMAQGRGEYPTDAGLFNELSRMYVEVWCHSDVAKKIVDYCNSSHFAGIGMSVGVSPLLVSSTQAAALH
jgi:hypothetical protein